MEQRILLTIVQVRVKMNDDNDGSATQVLDEDQFSQPDGEEEAPEWADSILGGSAVSTTSQQQQSASSKLPEEPDPAGFRSDVTLRPYQRQALHWMLHRENDSPDRADLTQELELLSELAAISANVPSTASSTSQYVNNQSKDVVCECGPVQVSEEAASKSVTIRGDVDPVRHPLWQRRFLTTDDHQSVICFYVNEVLCVASAAPPNPPRQCIGGILADSMGMGKSVMLLALILKSKEKREIGCQSTDITDGSPSSKRKRTAIDLIDFSSDEENDGNNTSEHPSNGEKTLLE